MLSSEIETRIKQKIDDNKHPITPDREEQIANFLLEFSEEFRGSVDNEILKEQQEVLKKLLDELF
ncbi:MAG TPA: hypothetical protein ENI29_03765 [bacterium]|nr:hypothetical protein [bacterium]